MLCPDRPQIIHDGELIASDHFSLSETHPGDVVLQVRRGVEVKGDCWSVAFSDFFVDLFVDEENRGWLAEWCRECGKIASVVEDPVVTISFDEVRPFFWFGYGHVPYFLTDASLLGETEKLGRFPTTPSVSTEPEASNTM